MPRSPFSRARYLQRPGLPPGGRRPEPADALAGAGREPATGPPSGRASVADIPVLSWDRVSATYEYDVQVSENIGFTGTKVFDVNTVNTNYVPVRVLKEGLLYWRVQAGGRHRGRSVLRHRRGDDRHPRAAHGPHRRASQRNHDPSAGVAAGHHVERRAAVRSATTSSSTPRATASVASSRATSRRRPTSRPTRRAWASTNGLADFFVRVRAKFHNSLQTDWTPYSSYNVAQLDAVTSATCGAGLVCAPNPGGGHPRAATVQDVVFDWDPVAGRQAVRDLGRPGPRLHQPGRDVASSTPRGTHPMTTYDNSNVLLEGSRRSTPRASPPRGRPTPASSSGAGRTAVAGLAAQRPRPAPSATTSTSSGRRSSTPALYRLEISPDPNFSPGRYETCSTALTTYAAGYKGERPVHAVPGLTFATGGSGRSTTRRASRASTPMPTRILATTSGYKFVYSSGVVNRQSPANGARRRRTRPCAGLRAATRRSTRSSSTTTTAPRSTSTTTSALSWTPEERAQP